MLTNYFNRPGLSLPRLGKGLSDLDSYTGRYTVTVRLFNLVSELAPEKQFILYKQLVKENVTTELLKLIIDMSEEEKFQLLEQLDEIPYENGPLRTVNLDDHESFMRENPRKICLIPVKCRIENRSFSCHVIDISVVGVFIESNERFTTGQKITMTLKLPNYHQEFELKGQITRSGPAGFGVKFNELTQTQLTIIRNFVESQK